MTGDLRTEAERIAAEIRERGGKVQFRLGEWWASTAEAERILCKAPGYLRKLRDKGQAPLSWTNSPPGSRSPHHWYEIKTLLGLGRSDDQVYFQKPS